MPLDHINEIYGCPKCAGQNLTKDDFIKKANKKHNFKYDYNEIMYVNKHTKINIKCKQHGLFSQSPSAHLSGNGCNQCSIDKRTYNQEEFIDKCKKKHGDKFCYSKTKYQGINKEIIIICPKHGEFTQKAGSHFLYGCRKCINVISNKETIWLDIMGVPKNCRNISLKINNKIFNIDGYIKGNNGGGILFEFLGDYWHGSKKFNENKINEITKSTFKKLFDKTVEKIRLLRKAGFKVICIWESKFDRKFGKKKKQKKI